jgi:hypothetical protein
VAVRTAELHHNRRDGFRILHAPCPGCGELLVSGDVAVLDRALAHGVCRRELLPVAEPFTTDDVHRLREALDSGWPWPDEEGDS